MDCNMGRGVRRYYGQWVESVRCPPGRVPWVPHRVGHHAILAGAGHQGAAPKLSCQAPKTVIQTRTLPGMIRLSLRRISRVAYVSVLLMLAGIGWAVAFNGDRDFSFGLLFCAAMAFLLIRRHNRG